MRLWTAGLALAVLAGFAGCTSDAGRGDSAARQAGRKAYEVSQKAKKAADKAARELQQAGKEARRGWNEAKREDRAHPKK